jgi:hypothetical protein
MQALPQFAADYQDWQAGADSRLRVSMLLATLLVAGVLSLVRLQPPGQFAPILELVVDIVSRDTDFERERWAAPLPQPVEAPIPDRVIIEAPEITPTNADRAAPTDWGALRDEAIREVLDAAERERRYSVNPAFQNARREAAIRFRASVAPGERRIWDNVEKDQLGRTILRDGNCWRVLDDPNVTSRWAFENFDRYIVYCDFVFGNANGKELPWVEIIRERYPYLRDPVEIP